LHFDAGLAVTVSNHGRFLGGRFIHFVMAIFYGMSWLAMMGLRSGWLRVSHRWSWKTAIYLIVWEGNFVLTLALT